MSRARPTYFVTEKLTAGSSMMRIGLAEQMCAAGENVRVITQTDPALGNARDAIVVFVKNFDSSIVANTRQNDNKVIWAPVDFFAVNPDVPDCSLFDGAIFPNSRAQKDFTPLFQPGIQSTVIGGYADPRWRCAKTWRFRLAYMGHRKNLDERYRNIKGLCTEYFGKSRRDLNRFFRRSSRYSCHFSVTPENSPRFLYKPDTKLTGAAACGANIILSKNPAHLDVLDPDYPYYTQTDIESVAAMVKFARATYRKPEWKRGLEMMRAVREKTTRERVAKAHSEFFARFE